MRDSLSIVLTPMRRLQGFVVLGALATMSGCGVAGEVAGAGADSGAGTIHGAGYTFASPAGWEDVSAAEHKLYPTIDVAVRAPSGRFRANVNVVVTSATALGSTDLHSFVATSTMDSQLQKVSAHPAQVLPDVTIDGADAVGYESHGPFDGSNLIWTVYAVEHGGHTLVITLTSSVTNTAAARHALDGLLSSWQWAG